MERNKGSVRSVRFEGHGCCMLQETRLDATVPPKAIKFVLSVRGKEDKYGDSSGNLLTIDGRADVSI